VASFVNTAMPSAHPLEIGHTIAIAVHEPVEFESIPACAPDPQGTPEVPDRAFPGRPKAICDAGLGGLFDLSAQPRRRRVGPERFGTIGAVWPQ